MRNIVIVGTGAAGLVAAITAAECGLRVTLLEKANQWGGTSSWSGGALWIPAHPLMLENGVSDSLESARAYMDSCISQSGEASSPERRDAYLRTGPEMVRFLADVGMKWEFSPFPDYYIERENARGGRGLGAAAFDGSELGDWVKTLRPASQVPQVAIEPLEVLPLLMATKNLKNLISSARVGLRTLGRRLAGERPLWMGQALVARLMQIALKRGVDVRLGTALVDLLTENGRVVGARVRHNGVDSDLRADAGIVLCAGGFARNSALRKKYQGVDDCLSAAVPEDTGDALHAALKLGAATTLLDEAWWGVSAVFPDDTRYFLLWERTFPHSLIVDAGGNRFADEAAPYNDFGRAVLDRQREFAGAPCWLIMDARHRRNYVFGNLLGGYTPDSLISKGVFKKASSLEDLARQCHLDPAALQRTVERFNVFAKTGKDEDFGRGDTIFDRVYGDADTKPNPTLGAVEQAPFWAVRVHPSDLGTKGGLLTDADGRVVDTAGQPIPGLYASGNATASVMGRGYPGPGATLGPATVFAYRAVRHAVLAGAPAGERAASA